MKSYRKELWFSIPDRVGMINIPAQVEEALKESAIRRDFTYDLSDPAYLCTSKDASITTTHSTIQG